MAKAKDKIVGKGWGYRNVTENGCARKPTTNREKAEKQLADVKAANPQWQFEMVDFDIVEVDRVVWRQGQGRAGNSFPTKQKEKQWVPRYR
jgi:hypothetical protein